MRATEDVDGWIQCFLQNQNPAATISKTLWGNWTCTWIWLQQRIVFTQNLLLTAFCKNWNCSITSTKRKGKLLHKMQLEVASKFKTLYGGLCQCDNLDERRLMKHAKDAVQHLSLSIMFYSPVRFRKRRLCGVFGNPEIALSSGYQQIDTPRALGKPVKMWMNGYSLL